jgi:Xaa-Pro aminopeptidase
VYPHQAERLTASLEAEGLEALVATSPENVRYVTGFESLSRAAAASVELFGVFTPRGTALVVPSIDAPTVAWEQPDVDHVVCHGGPTFAGESGGETERRILAWSREAAATPAEALARALDALGARRARIGLDGGGLSAAAWRHLVEALAGAHVADGAGALATARTVKGPYEIECLERSLSVAEEGVNAVIQMLKPGVTEAEAAALFETEVARRGARPYATTLTMGARSAFPAVGPADVALRPGGLVRFDLGCVFRGYRSKVARTAVMGPPTERQERVYTALEAGLEAALDVIQPAVPAARVFEAVVRGVKDGGLPDYRLPRVGHGVGLEACEAPTLGPGDQTPLAPGMVLLIDAPYYEPGWGGVQIKETVLVTTRGARTMNRSVRGLVVLD